MPVGLALPLPNGDALMLEVEGDKAHVPGDDQLEAGFVVHSALLGRIEVRVRIGDGAVSARVIVEDPAVPLARASAPDLAVSLGAATGAPVQVGVSTRAVPSEGARQPRVAEGLDAYA
jgi:hypothetical protein